MLFLPTTPKERELVLRDINKHSALWERTKVFRSLALWKDNIGLQGEKAVGLFRGPCFHLLMLMAIQTPFTGVATTLLRKL